MAAHAPDGPRAHRADDPAPGPEAPAPIRERAHANARRAAGSATEGRMAKTKTLVDDFNDDQRDTALWTGFGAYRETGGRIELSPPGVAGSYAGYESAVTYDLTDSRVHVELVSPLRAAEGADCNLLLTVDASNSLGISVEAGQVFIALKVGGTFSSPGSVPYDPDRHRWLRLREKGGTVHWETSADGAAYETLHAQAVPFALTALNVGISAGTYQDVAAPGIAVFDNLNVRATSRSRRVEERRLAARAVREQAAELAASRRHFEHANNDDEVNYPALGFVGNFSKSLRHDALGDPDPVSYGSLLRALESRDPADFEEILLGEGGKKLTNPQAGLAFDLQGPDAQALTQPPAPRFDSEQAAHEMGELYWMAAARDVWFGDYGSDAIIARAADSLTTEFPRFGGTVPVTPQNIFRGIFPGAQAGPYVSQFLWKGNADPRKPDGQGRDADEGFITYGTLVIDQRQLTVVPGVDYLTEFSWWLAAQNGKDFRGDDQFDPTRRFIRNLRDGGNYVHFDQVLNAFYNAAFLLLSEPTGNQLSGVGAGRPQVDAEFPLDQGNPYDPPGTARDSRTQVGFATFGAIHILQALCEVTGRAAREVWWQKWGVHRRLRPEEYGGRVDNHLAGRRTYPIEKSVLTSLDSGGLSAVYPNATGTYLLPQLFPEGAPTHPAYGAGHATISGACATMLKAFFDEDKAIENPVMASADGLSLVPLATDPNLTVGGELNKLAHNISLFRNAAGVHWRTDDVQSLLLGEEVAVRLLQEMSLTFNEDSAFFQLTRLDGRTIRIYDGIVDLVP